VVGERPVTPPRGPGVELRRASATIRLSRVFAGAAPLLEIAAPSARFVHADHVGSRAAATDAQGSKAGSARYLPFGDAGASADADVARFSEREEDASGLTYFHHRSLSPATGRFAQSDPVLTTAASSFAYARANPLRFIDPAGLASYAIICRTSMISRRPRHSTRKRWIGGCGSSSGMNMPRTG